MRTKTGEKRPLLLSRGRLDKADRMLRISTLIFMAVLSVSLSFTQLGFAGIGADGEYEGYAIILLVPVSLTALLLGTLPGTAIGLVAGVALYVHSLWMPLDFYELTFVNEFTSITMLTITGFLLGILFSFALRNDPKPLRAFIYIAIVCIIVSWIFSFQFVINGVSTLAAQVAVNLPSEATEAEIDIAASTLGLTLAVRLGSIDLQMWFDALIMLFSCTIAYVLAKAVINKIGQIGLRGLFTAWLFNVVLIAFMISSVASFAGTTFTELSTAADNMQSEITYIRNQLEASMDRSDALSKVLDSLDISVGDLSTEDMNRITRAVADDKLLNGYTIEGDGTVIVSTNLEEGSSGDLLYLCNDDSFTRWDALSDNLNIDIVEAIDRSIEEGKVQRIVYDGSKAYIASEYQSFKEGQSALRTQIAYLMAEEDDYYNVAIIQPSTMVFADRANVMGWTTLTSIFLLLAVFALSSILLHNLVVRRIDETNGVLTRIGKGDLDARVDVRDTPELSSLSDGINDTVVTLKGWIAEAETRMDAELATAKAIQEAALPRIFPPYPDIQHFDIYATMKAAKEVGGDFYDFFLIGADPDATKLGFVIADVSGKGVPAALFMMKAKTQIRDYMESGMELGEAIENANRQLCEGNDAGMFVTAFAGILDYTNGHVEYVNAGHNPPLVWQVSDWHWLNEKSGLPLGLFDGMPYQAFSAECQIGDQLLLYTDGVTEAMNVEDELYGEQRLEDVVRRNFTLHPRRLVDTVRKDVARFAQGAVQSDDITILALEYGVPPELTATLVVPAEIDALTDVNNFIHTELDRRLCPLRTQMQLDIAVEELFVNVARYAYPDSTPEHPGLVRVSYTYSAEPPSIRVSIADTGIPYNPLDKPDAVTPDDIADVPIGGLGILMAKRSVNEMTYERLDGSNIVAIVKKW